jgi:hypothetical protein
MIGEKKMNTFQNSMPINRYPKSRKMSCHVDELFDGEYNMAKHLIGGGRRLSPYYEHGCDNDVALNDLRLNYCTIQEIEKVVLEGTRVGRKLRQKLDLYNSFNHKVSQLNREHPCERLRTKLIWLIKFTEEYLWKFFEENPKTANEYWPEYGKHLRQTSIN